MNNKVCLLFWASLCGASAIQSFSLQKNNNDVGSLIDICHFTRRTQASHEILAICGYKGEACSIAVYKNQSEAHIQRAMKCECLEQVFPYIDIAYQHIPGKLLRNYLLLLVKSGFSQTDKIGNISIIARGFTTLKNQVTKLPVEIETRPLIAYDSKSNTILSTLT